MLTVTAAATLAGLPAIVLAGNSAGRQRERGRPATQPPRSGNVTWHGTQA